MTITRTRVWRSKWKKNGIELQTPSGHKEPSTDLIDILSILSDEDEGYSHANFVWDVDLFFAPILRLFPQNALRELIDTNWLKISNYGRVLYIRGKLIGLYEGQYQPVYFYSLGQYYPNENEPEILNDVWILANKLIQTLEGMGVYSKSFVSPAKIYEQGILDHLPDVPTAFDVPKEAREVNEFAWHCAGKPWIECFNIGHFEHSFDYDQTSAYPNQICKLQNTKYALYRKDTNMIDSADWGFLYGRLTINPEIKINPFTCRREDGTIYNPAGTRKDYITLDGYRFIQKWGIGGFELIEGWFVKFKSPQTPLKNPMERLFNYRGNADFRDHLAKRMANGAIGKFLEEHKHDKGQYWHPMYGAMVHERTRLEVADFVYRNKMTVQDVIAINTDGVLCLKDLHMKSRPKKMGQWRLSEEGPAIAESSGNVFHGNKKPHGITYDILRAAIEEKPNASYYSMKAKRLVTINDIIEGKAEWENLGKPKEFATSSIDLNKLLAVSKTDGLDRVYDGIPKSGHELMAKVYSSSPIILNN